MTKKPSYPTTVAFLLILNEFKCDNIIHKKLFALLCADDTVVFGTYEKGFHDNLDLYLNTQNDDT